MRSVLLAAGLVGLGGLFVVGCGGSGGSGSGSAQAAAAVTSAAPSATTSSAVTTQPPPLGLTPALADEVARRCAPSLRFNAYFNDGNTSRQNRSEDFFPMSVASFLRQLASQQTRVATQESNGTQAGVNEVVATSDRALFGSTHLGPFPRKIAGDEPGQAPLYTSVYEDVSARAQAPDGSGELVLYVEHWIFYAYDRAEVRILFFTTGGFDPFGHRADWEHVSSRVRVYLDPGAVVVGLLVEEGAFYGHGGAVLAYAPSLELVDDLGQPDPLGTHPVVYVSQGKHASYPQAGEWRDHAVPSWLAGHTDFFRGNGVRVDTWLGPLFSLDDPAANPAEFSPPELALLASPVADWTLYPGGWGPDLTLLNLQQVTLRVGLSPTGPLHKNVHQGFHAARGPYPNWDDVKASEPNLRVYSDVGITIPPSPQAAPVRR
jgi:hypothetical protein